ncbi:COG1361 S-layer family protein [Roseimaritima ulvae]|uniref:Bone sialoprotein-binding protein n=1 Tax=Roseimaritima ulvae TaxID=980254 RepID=A0A5B9QWV5_9BACT|nr:SdrD B-like domain-containing protein [Roseimaritima ulvae]QEG41865.1 Bone sialoprotein-binding protein precursor [Roseimaritima ulvae]
MVLSRLFHRLNPRNRKQQPQRRRLQLERLAKRELLAADLGVITGTVYTDLAGDDSVNSIVNTSGATVADPVLENVDVTLYLDDGTNPGVLDVGAGADTLVGTDTTGADGVFRFEGLSPGQYLLVQTAVAGLISNTDPVVVTVTDDDGEEVQSIDDFSSGDQSLSVADDTQPPDVSSVAGSMIGGERDMQLTNQNGGDPITLIVDTGSTQLTLASPLGVTANGLVQYDGIDGSITLDATGLNSADLVQGTEGTGLLLGVFGDLAGGTLNVRIYTDADNASETTVNVPVDVAIQELFVQFSDFTTLGGATGPADFTDVGAIEAELQGVASLDARISVLSSIAPVEVTQNLANYEPLTLGDTVFRDNDDNGVQDAGEPGITGVDVNLYLDADASGDLDTGTDTFIGTTTTIAGGAYSFTNLEPGTYLVQIPTTEFAAGQALFGYTSSAGNDPAPDPDDNVDEDDNGTLQGALGVVSSAITLVSQGEPIDDGDADPSTNLTLDFGFVPEADLMVAKELLTATPTAGEEASFRITVTNNGDLVANNLVIEDAIPAGLVFNRIENASAGLDAPTVSGTTVTATATSLAVGASLSFDIIVDIPASTTGNAIVNTATVTADEKDSVPGNNSDTAAVPITVDTDLRIQKDADLTTVASGGTLTYTMVVTNDGPSDATGVIVTDTLPADVTFSSGNVEGDGAAVTANNGVITADVGDLADGESKTITIVVDVAPNAEDTLTNTATVSNVPDTDNNPDNDTDTAVTDVNRQVDVGITKTASADPVAGELMTYTFLVENNGTGDARGVTVTDTLPANLSFDSFAAGTSGATLDQTGQDLTFTIGDLAAGASASFTIDVLIDASVADDATISNTAVVDTTDIDTNTDNDSSTVPVTVEREVDLSVTKDDNVDTGVPGQAITYTIVAQNNGPSDASGVQIIDTLPAAFTVTAVNQGNTTFVSANGVITFTVGDLAAGASETVTITGTIDSSATNELVNSVEVDGNETETDNTDNEVDEQTPLVPAFDLVLSKTGLTEIAPGGNLTYTITVSNASGPSDATGLVITDTLPAGTTFVSGSINGQAATESNGVVTFDAGTLAAGDSVSATLTVTVDAGATGTLSNTATVSAAENEAVTSNNTDTADTDLVPDVDLTVGKTVTLDDAQVGAELTYTITVTNDGTSTATSVTATDTLPAGLTFVSGTGPDGALSATGQTIDVSIGTLAAGASETFTIIASIDADASGDLVNSVTVATPLTEVDATNNTAQATTTVDPVLSTIAGVVYVDSNNNGVQDAGEAGIADVTMTLTGTDTLGNTISRTVTTGSDGAYLFDQLPAGTYTLTQTDPDQFLDGQDSAGTIDGVASGATVGNDEISNILLGSDVDAVMFNFGELNQPFSKRRFLASTT